MLISSLTWVKENAGSRICWMIDKASSILDFVDITFYFSFLLKNIFIFKYVSLIMLLQLSHYFPYCPLHPVSPYPPAIPPLVHVHGLYLRVLRLLYFLYYSQYLLSNLYPWTMLLIPYTIPLFFSLPYLLTTPQVVIFISWLGSCSISLPSLFFVFVFLRFHCW